MLTGAHGLGANSVSWAPAARAGSLVSVGGEKGGRRFVSGGSDCLAKIWDWEYAISFSYFHLPYHLATIPMTCAKIKI